LTAACSITLGKALAASGEVMTVMLEALSTLGRPYQSKLEHPEIFSHRSAYDFPSRLLKKWLLEGKNTHFHI
jgi:hypothetical protein